MIVEPMILLAFIPAALALNLTPGADMMFCMGQGLHSGPWQAVAGSAGISLGGMVHVTLAGLGLSAVIASTPWVFDVIRWVGILYLLWLAWTSLRPQTAQTAEAYKHGIQRAFLRGFAVNLTNPKVILFTLAFVPQFVQAERGQILAQFLVFGGILGVGGFVINGGVGLLAGVLGRKLSTNGRFTKTLGWISAGIFTALALRLAVGQKG